MTMNRRLLEALEAYVRWERRRLAACAALSGKVAGMPVRSGTGLSLGRRASGCVPSSVPGGPNSAEF